MIQSVHKARFLHLLLNSQYREQGRIQDSPQEGAPTLQGEAPTYDFAKFSEKLHEIEKKLGRRGRPLLDPLLASHFCDRIFDWYRETFSQTPQLDINVDSSYSLFAVYSDLCPLFPAKGARGKYEICPRNIMNSCHQLSPHVCRFEISAKGLSQSIIQLQQIQQSNQKINEFTKKQQLDWHNKGKGFECFSPETRLIKGSSERRLDETHLFVLDETYKLSQFRKKVMWNFCVDFFG